MTVVAQAPHTGRSRITGAAWVVGVGCWVLSLGSLVLFFTSRRPGRSTEDWLFVVTDAGMAAVYGTVASVLLARRRHVVIIFLLLAAVGGGLAALGGAWRQAALVGGLPSVPAIETLFSTAWVPGTLSLFLVVPWLVRREIDRAAWLQALPGLVIMVAFLIIGQTIPEEAYVVVAALLGVVVCWGLVSAAAVERRRRSAEPGESEGLAWLAVGTAVMALSFVPLLLPYGLAPFWSVPALHLACQTIYPIAILAVVARQRLWGLELTVSRAAVVGALTAVLLAVYLLVGLVISQVIGSQTVAALVATATVVAALQPSRLWLQRRVRRMVYGEGADPTSVAARLGSALGRAASSDELLTSVAETLGRTLRLESVTLIGADDRVRTQWGTPTSQPDQQRLTHRGRAIGSLAITTPPGEALDGHGRAALDQLLEVVTAALALAESAADLEATRDRLTTARLKERQVIRRELHDGLVPWLAGLRLGLQGVQNLVGTDPAAATAMLAELQSELARRIDDVRAASRSLLPPVLSELGLYAALRELVERQQQAGMTVELDCSPSLGTQPLSDGLAAAAYGIASEAVTNAARHSGADRCRLVVTVEGDQLVIVCSDAGSGIADDAITGVGTRSMIERAEDQGGSLTVDAAEPTGTVVRAALPLVARSVEARSASDELITVVVVDDHPVFRLGMVGLLGSLPGIRVVGQAASRSELEPVITEPPRVIMMDLHLGGESGIELTRWLAHTRPEIAVLVITMSDDDESVAAAMRAGARGYLLKAAAPAEVERAIRAVANGEMILGPQVAARAMAQVVSGRTAARVPFPELTDREREVLDLVARGYDNATISKRLLLSPKTVRNHIANVMAKLALKDRAAAIIAAREAGLGS